MRKMLVVMVVLVSVSLIVLGAVYNAVERDVSFFNQGQLIRGILTLPEGQSRNVPLVLLFHGFTGQKDEMDVAGTNEAMFEMTARIFAENGIASLRIDFRGSGESEGAWEDTTFSGQISDAMAAISFVQSIPEINPNRIGVLGLSQGGLVAAATAARDPRVKAAILWNPVAIPAFTYSLILGVDTVLEALTLEGEETIDATLPWGEVTTLKKSFYQELFLVDPAAEIASYKGPLMVVVGLQDDVVFPQPHAGVIFTNYHSGLQKLVELETDHLLGIFVGPEVLKIVIDKAIDWIGMTL